MGVDPPPEGRRPEQQPDGHDELSVRSMWIVGIAVGGLYAFGAIIRGDVLPGIVGGVLAAILCFLVLRELAARRRRRGR